MILSAIVATDLNNLIGDGEKMPWHLPADLKHFKNITSGHTIIMGRKTYQSLPNGALPKRRNIVLSRTLQDLPDAELFGNITELLENIKNEEQVFIIGGAEIYRLFMSYINQLYITKIHHTFKGTVYFPMPDLTTWELISEQNFKADDRNKWNYSFFIYQKK